MKHVYLHIPFCQRRCSYCNFNTFANLEDRIEAYVDALCAELRMYAQQPADQTTLDPSPCTLTRATLKPTLFLGGGTPTILSLAQMERVLAAAATLVPLEQAEVTTEANPGTVIDEAYLRGLRVLGINRISFGVQSLHDPTLRMLGRIHTTAEALATYRQARRAGFDRINLDFIFGLPGQTLEQWRWTLDAIAALEADHLSLYSLVLEADTPLYRQVMQGSVVVPQDDTTAAMYELAMERLAAEGYVHYEISNWACDDFGSPILDLGSETDAGQANIQTRAPTEYGHPGSRDPLPMQASHHNVAYWLNADYLGCGAGAHGHHYPQRWHNILGVDAYIAAVRAGRLPIAETVPLTPDDLYFETMMMGLRLHGGVSFAHFVDRCGRELLDVYEDEIATLTTQGLLQWDEDGVRLTGRGRMLGNNVFVRFLRDAEPSSADHA